MLHDALRRHAALLLLHQLKQDRTATVTRANPRYLNYKSFLVLWLQSGIPGTIPYLRLILGAEQKPRLITTCVVVSLRICCFPLYSQTPTDFLRCCSWLQDKDQFSKWLHEMLKRKFMVPTPLLAVVESSLCYPF